MKNPNEIFSELVRPAIPEKHRSECYGVRTYSPFVKVSNWWYYREALPQDNDHSEPPLDPNKSTYNRLGTYVEDGSNWVTETAESQRKGIGDGSLEELIKQSQPRRMVTFLSYPRTEQVRRDLLPDEIREILPSLPKNLMQMRYTTTHNTFFKPVRCMPQN